MAEPSKRHPIARAAIKRDTLDAGTELQRLEWAVLIDEVARGGLASELEGAELLFDRTRDFASVEVLNAGGEARIIDLATPEVTANFYEYVSVVSQMMDGDLPVSRLEALDMAKKVVHDHAARALKAKCAPSIHGDLEAFRRIFSLIVALRVEPKQIRATRRHG